MKNRGLIWLLALLMFVFGSAAAEITTEEVITQFGENEVRYPQLSGMEDEAVQQKINDDIVLSSGVANHMVSLFTLAGNQTLKMDYDAYLNDQIFSTVISAKGKLPGKRDGHEYTALTYDLKTGERVGLEAVFSDVDAAIALMEEKAVASLSEELNGYLEYSDITPLPADRFTLDEHGISFWYPAEQFSLISGYSGACQFWYEELEGLLIADPTPQLTREERQKAIEQSAADGKLPHVPVQIGQNMQEIADEYRLLREPDEFPGGRYFIMEDPAFRSILIISDSLQSDYSHSVAEGIQLRRGGLYGLDIGETTRQEWLEMLGQPKQSFAMTESMAYDYGLCTGQCDIYVYGDHELRLYSDDQQTLFAIQLCQ